MNYQTMSGQGSSPIGMSMDPMPPHSSHKVWYIIGAVVLVVILGVVSYLYYGTQSMPAGTQTPATAIEKVQTTGLSAGDTTEEIMADLEKTLNDVNGLEQAAASSAAAVQSF